MEHYFDIIPEELLIILFSKLNLDSTLNFKKNYEGYFEEKEILFRDVIALMYPWFWGSYNQSMSEDMTPLPWNNFLLHIHLLMIKEKVGENNYLFMGNHINLSLIHI